MSRPFALDPLFRALTTLPGVGPKNAKLFEKLTGGPKILDLLWHLPVDVVDRSAAPSLKDLQPGQVITVEVTVDKHSPNERKSQPYKVWCRDETGTINLVFFHATRPWLEKLLPPGEKRIISGRVEFFNGQPQILHPDAVVKPEERDEIEKLEPIYPLTQGLTNKIIRKALSGSLGFIPTLPEWLDAAYKKREGLPDWDEALKAAHFEKADDEPLKARQRLAYDELLANQLTLALVRQRMKKKSGRSFKPEGVLLEKLVKSLPFALTGAQERALQEISTDMAEPLKMMRLLQGDVGSGKTIVAALALLNAVECGAQGALMAPTEILARQHYAGLKPLLEPLGVNVIALTGRDKGKDRDALLAQIADGTAQMVIGTHALFQDSIHFHDLGLAVIDEQHRFGVHQRLELSSKGKGTDVLVMTATPIPRTLTLTAYGDMDVSQLNEKPPGRKPIDTRLIPIEKIEAMVEGLKRQIAEGARVYWVCPLVEESEKLDLSAAEERYDVLQHWIGARVGLIHGRLKPDEKDAVMGQFARGEIDVLVATTVIEVGVNVPEATIMVIEHAERFGLSQLHQLRGRVGRGGDKSYCFLLYTGPLGETARERLSVMRETEDGFLIAEKDLELRGAGDILGVKQSGLVHFRLANIEGQADLLATASDDARLILDRDPELKSPRGEALRVLLYLFERDQAIRYLGSG